jgi:hypothetical protein
MAVCADVEATMDEVLLDQRIACGVGNVYKSEVLWAVGVHPFTQLGAVPIEVRAQLIETASRLLRANLRTSRRITTARAGLAVYGRFGKPCPRCSTPIEVRRHGEQARVTYWCPGCQVMLAPASAEADHEPEGEPVDPTLLAETFDDGFERDELVIEATPAPSLVDWQDEHWFTDDVDMIDERLDDPFDARADDPHVDPLIARRGMRG